MGKSAKNTASTTKDNTRTQYREKSNRENITENENRAYNNHIDAGRIGKAVFLPSETRKDTQIGKYTQRKRKPLRSKKNGEIDDVVGMGRKK